MKKKDKTKNSWVGIENLLEKKLEKKNLILL